MPASLVRSIVFGVRNARSSEAAKLVKVCDRLQQLAAELRRGESFPVTRLTCLKAVCRDHKLATEFALRLANLAGRPSRMQGCISPEERRLLALFRKTLASRPSVRRSPIFSPVWDVLKQFEEFQNEYKPLSRGPVRLIRSRRLLVVEKALRCILPPVAAPFWAYQAARDYAGRHDPSSPFGLVRKSAPAIMDLARFWCAQAKPLRKTYDTRSK